MKQSDNIEKDAAFLRANIETNEERIKLPGSLSEENIVDLVSGKKQKHNKKAIIKRFAGVAVAACVALGIFTDILVNNILRYIQKTPGANDRWMMFPKKELSSLFLNIIYAYVVLSFVYMFYNLINSVLAAGGHELLGVGPDGLLEQLWENSNRIMGFGDY